MRSIFISIILSFIGTAAFSQKVHYPQELYWLRYQNQLFFSDKLYWTNEIDNRRFIGNDVQNQLIMHSRLHKRIGKWDVAGGLTYSLAYAAFPDNGFRKPNHEIRPVLEASHEQPTGRFFIQNRFRVDHRFFQEDRDHSVFQRSDYLMRLRYRLQFRFVLRKNADNVPTIGLRVANEIMVNSEKNFYDQNRVYVTADFFINRRLSLETGYLYIDQQRLGTDDEFFSRNVFRFSVLHKVFLD